MVTVSSVVRPIYHYPVEEWRKWWCGGDGGVEVVGVVEMWRWWWRCGGGWGGGDVEVVEV